MVIEGPQKELEKISYRVPERLEDVLQTIRTVLINVSWSVDGLGRVKGIFTPPRLMVPPVVMMPVGFVVRACVSVHM